MITMMITKDDDKGDDKKLKDQSKNNSSESKLNQRTTQVNQEEFKISRIKIKIQESREGSIKISTKKVFQNIE